jgi:16S rRNA processing protein RimM
MGISEIIDLRAKKEAAKASQSWIAIGNIRKTVGLDGWLRVGLLTDHPWRFEPGTEILIQKHSMKPEPVVVDDWRDHFTGTAIEIKLEGVEDIESAAIYVNSMVVIPKSERQPLTSDKDFYPDELEGMSIMDPDGTKVGTVVKLEVEVPCPYFIVKTELKENEEIMVPFIKRFVEKVDRETKTVRLVEPLAFHSLVE